MRILVILYFRFFWKVFAPYLEFMFKHVVFQIKGSPFIVQVSLIRNCEYTNIKIETR